MTRSSSSTESSNLELRRRRSRRNQQLSTDLRLGLGISSDGGNDDGDDEASNWPPMKPQRITRRGLAEENHSNGGNGATFYVKVYMEGIPIGRKLDLLALHGYHALIRTLDHMFNTNIKWTEMDGSATAYAETCHVLTYEDREGDWMMVGDVPWEMFLSTVRRLKITRAM